VANPTQFNDIASQMTAKSVEVFSLWADVNQKVLRELVDLSASAAKEGVRLYAEIQSSAVEGVKEGQTFVLRRQGWMREAPKDPFGFCQKSAVETVETAQRTLKLFEGNVQAMTRSAERLQVTAEQAFREIQTTFAQLTGTVKSLYTPAA
jgi:hypothetical protein